MADGTIDTGSIGDSIKQALMQRYAQQQGQVQAQQKQAFDMAQLQQQGRNALLGHLTLSQPGGGPMPASAYLGAVGGGAGALPPGTMASPTQQVVGQERNLTAENTADTRAASAKELADAKAASTKELADTQAKHKQALADLQAQHAKELEVLKGRHAQQRADTAATGRKSPDEKKHAELNSDLKLLQARLKTEQANDLKRRGGSVRSYSNLTQTLQKDVDEKMGEIKALGGKTGGGADAPAQVADQAAYDALPKGAHYTGPDGHVRMKQ